jgi:hypothetical protein
MLNTLALSFRPEDFRLFVIYVAATVSALLAVAAGWLRSAVTLEDRRQGVLSPLSRVLAGAVVLVREAAVAHKGARLACRWVRDGAGGLVCRWTIARPIGRRSQPPS